jgi:eukaryotic-like serine/threonine-protein kinase
MASDRELATTVEDATRPAPVDASELPRGLTIDRYVLIDKVGRGGMGVVYSAYDHTLHRRVAVKLMTSQGRGSQLLAEARAMAQLSHPAIVPVHDVGEFGGRVFLAMAFIDGRTLREWQTHDDRTWQQLVAMYRGLGLGLAFAHDEGIIHRDFKPDNVLVDDDGQPHITDFGLAKIVLVPDSVAATSADPTTTLTGSIAGTPGYMSPEQSRGEPTDARTDQYAFCASMFEALHRGLPRDKPPPRTDLPGRILAAIERGLADDPGQRWPSMRELLAALAPPKTTRRRRAIVAVGAVFAISLAIWLVMQHRTAADRCDAPQANVLWQPARDPIRAAFAARPAAGEELVAALDTWTTRWTDMAQASCRATAVGSQSTKLLDLRARCLDHTLDVTRSLIDLASHADPELVRHSATIARNLPSLEPCADTEGLLGTAPLPSDPLRRGVIAELGRRLAAAEADVVVEAFHQASAELDAVARPIQAIGYTPQMFELYDTRARVEIARDSDPAAAASAAWSAIAIDPSRDDLRVAGVWIDLVWIVGVMQHAPAQAIEIGRVAEAIEVRVQDRHQISLLAHRLATVLFNAGKLDEAIEQYERAGAGYAAHGDIYDGIVNISAEAAAVGARGDKARQLALYEQAVAQAQELPHAQLLLALQLNELSIAYTEAGRYREASAALQRALVAMGDGQDNPALLAAIHGNLGNAAEKAGDLATAETEYRAGLELARTQLGADVSDVQIAWYNLATIENKRGAFADAVDALHHAQDILGRSPHAALESEAYAWPGEIARQLVVAQLGLHRPTDALASAEASLAWSEHAGVRPGTLADVHFALATAAWAAGDRARARTTMRLAAAEYREAGASTEEADAWIAAH